MSIITLEGIVDHGQIKLPSHIQLPDNTKVYIIVPDYQVTEYARIVSPRLVNRDQIVDFKMQIIEDQADASL